LPHQAIWQITGNRRKPRTFPKNGASKVKSSIRRYDDE
jgi:hypothetical protein